MAPSCFCNYETRCAFLYANGQRRRAACSPTTHIGPVSVLRRHVPRLATMAICQSYTIGTEAQSRAP